MRQKYREYALSSEGGASGNKEYVAISAQLQLVQRFTSSRKPEQKWLREGIQR